MKDRCRNGRCRNNIFGEAMCMIWELTTTPRCPDSLGEDLALATLLRKSDVSTPNPSSPSNPESPASTCSLTSPAN